MINCKQTDSWEADKWVKRGLSKSSEAASVNNFTQVHRMMIRSSWQINSVDVNKIRKSCFVLLPNNVQKHRQNKLGLKYPKQSKHVTKSQRRNYHI